MEAFPQRQTPFSNPLMIHRVKTKKIRTVTVLGITIMLSVIRVARWSNGKYATLRIERSGFKRWLWYCVVFLGKILYFQSASLHQGI